MKFTNKLSDEWSADEIARLISSGIFDSDYYLARYPDVMESEINPLIHYLSVGWKEGRSPSRNFPSAVVDQIASNKSEVKNPLSYLIAAKS